MKGRVLIVDDDVELCDLLASGLEMRGFEAAHEQSAGEALHTLVSNEFDVVISDLRMHGMSGIELCQRIVENRPDVPVVVVTAFGSMESAISAIRAGAYDFIVKPVSLDLLAISVARAVRHRNLQAEVRTLRKQVAQQHSFDKLVGTSIAMRELFDVMERIADSDASVLLEGETGTGKELIARSLHERGPRREGPFVAINCAAMPEPLLESELFGHAKGAFTDARGDHVGLLVRANGGTLFLDEIADMPLSLQPKLLRALQERTVRPVGATREIPFDARIVAATNQNLESAVEDKEFRADLFFRLNVVKVKVPPLSARRGDILLLAQSFLEQLAERAGKAVTGISPAAADRLLSYQWPGNVRELQNAIEHGIALALHEQLTVDDLPEKLRDYKGWQGPPSTQPDELISMQELERRYIAHVLESTGGNKRRAAQILKLDRATLYRRLARYNIAAGS